MKKFLFHGSAVFVGLAMAALMFGQGSTDPQKNTLTATHPGWLFGDAANVVRIAPSSFVASMTTHTTPDANGDYVVVVDAPESHGIVPAIKIKAARITGPVYRIEILENGKLQLIEITK